MSPGTDRSACIYVDNISYPFRYFEFPDLGRTFIPMIPINLETKKGLVEFNFLVDTGADFTTLPHFMAAELGLDLKRAKRGRAEGLGGHVVKTWIVKVKLLFPKKTLVVRATITDENSTPLLLGRADFLDVLYSWKFDSRQKEIIFEKV